MAVKLGVLGTLLLAALAAVPAPALAVCQWHMEWVYWATYWFFVWTC